MRHYQAELGSKLMSGRFPSYRRHIRMVSIILTSVGIHNQSKVT
jgi:hypothetical protein